MDTKYLLFIFILTVFVLLLNDKQAIAQQKTDAGSAFVRSLVVPGWGHYYVGSEHRIRGQVHFGTEVILVASYFGFRIRSSNLQEKFITLADLRAGVDISQRNRRFQLAIGSHSSLNQYNDFQLRSRNWNNLLDETVENRWNWSNEADRKKYNDLRAERDNIKNQLPALLGLMVINRVVSAISAYNRATSVDGLSELSFLPVWNHQGVSGSVATFTFRF